MARSTRNKGLSNKYNDIAAKIVADAIKGGRESKKLLDMKVVLTGLMSSHNYMR